jgi:hypothetical protein
MRSCELSFTVCASPLPSDQQACSRSPRTGRSSSPPRSPPRKRLRSSLRRTPGKRRSASLSGCGRPAATSRAAAAKAVVSCALPSWRAIVCRHTCTRLPGEKLRYLRKWHLRAQAQGRACAAGLCPTHASDSPGRPSPRTLMCMAAARRRPDTFCPFRVSPASPPLLLAIRPRRVPSEGSALPSLASSAVCAVCKLPSPPLASPETPPAASSAMLSRTPT